jgi:hypothetical protein
MQIPPMRKKMASNIFTKLAIATAGAIFGFAATGNTDPS